VPGAWATDARRVNPQQRERPPAMPAALLYLVRAQNVVMDSQRWPASMIITIPTAFRLPP